MLERIAAAGATASLDPGGRVRIAGVSRLPAGLLDLLRENKAAVAVALAGRGEASANHAADPTPAAPDPDDAAERAAMAEHHAVPPDPAPWHPGAADALRDGLLVGWHVSRRQRLGALVQRLHGARPKREHGVCALDWAGWEAAGRAAAELPSAEWAAWRGAAETDRAAWTLPGAEPPVGGASR